MEGNTLLARIRLTVVASLSVVALQALGVETVEVSGAEAGVG
jgi:hypothetical protein